jgi:uncharacterized membrane protein
MPSTPAIPSASVPSAHAAASPALGAGLKGKLRSQPLNQHSKRLIEMAGRANGITTLDAMRDPGLPANAVDTLRRLHDRGHLVRTRDGKCFRFFASMQQMKVWMGEGEPEPVVKEPEPESFMAEWRRLRGLD